MNRKFVKRIGFVTFIVGIVIGIIIGYSRIRLFNNVIGQDKGKFNFKEKNVVLNNGLVMPISGISTYGLDGDDCVNIVKDAIGSGVRLIDTAYMYGNEEAVGKAIRESKIDRKEIFVITKLYPNQYDKAGKAIDESLNKLNIDYIDMMLLHHPGSDDIKAYKEIEKYVKSGKIKSIGLANYYIDELKELIPNVKIKPALVQNEIHPYYNDRNVVDYIHSLGIVVQAWNSFGSDSLLSDKVLMDIARKHNKTVAQIILRWDLQNGVSVVPSVSSSEHIKENMEIYDFELSDEEMNVIDKINKNKKYDWY